MAVPGPDADMAMPTPTPTPDNDTTDWLAGDEFLNAIESLGSLGI